MTDRLDRLERPRERGPLIYPPVWYSDLVRLRFRTITGEPGEGSAPAGVHGVRSAGPNPARRPASMVGDSDGAGTVRLLVLAQEIMRPLGLDRLAHAQPVHVLGLDVLEVREYLHAAIGEAGLAAPAATLIIEDEAAVALDLARLVRRAGHQVCGTAARHDQAVAVAARKRPELVLADVQLGDGPEAGLAAVQDIRRAGEVPVVYVTAYPRRVNHIAPPTGLVVAKPFAADEVEAAIWRALYRFGRGASAAA